MAKTKIKRDSHGQYVRTNGSVYRPQESRYTAYIAHAYPNRDGFKDGEDVVVSAVSQSSYCRVKRGDYLEMWHDHGNYYRTDPVDGRLLPGFKLSDECWDPKE